MIFCFFLCFDGKVPRHKSSSFFYSARSTETTSNLPHVRLTDGWPYRYKLISLDVYSSISFFIIIKSFVRIINCTYIYSGKIHSFIVNATVSRGFPVDSTILIVRITRERTTFYNVKNLSDNKLSRLRIIIFTTMAFKNNR